jgi:serine/threonine protein kinase
MKTCPICETAYPNECARCTTDGAVLVPTAELDPGTVIRGKYRIIRTLGSGGMGTVYLAEHLLLGRFRALKFMSGQLSQDPRFFKRFRQEAQAAVELRHPNIVEVVDLGQAEDGTPYMAMEFVDGPDLRTLVKSGSLAIARSLAIAQGVARGLAAAHARGIVHRDLKPENILLAAAHTAHETAKLADFGIAAINDASSVASRTQALMLTPEYASPEQWRGLTAGELDGRADLYALGGVLYEMLTGNQAFSASNPEGWMYQHLHFDPPAPSALRHEVASWPGLDTLVLSLLAKDRERRTHSAEAAAAALDQLRFHTPVDSLRSAPVASAMRIVPASVPPPISSEHRESSIPAAVSPLVQGESDEHPGSRRSVPMALFAIVALLVAGVVLAFALPVSTLESLAESVRNSDHPGPTLLLYNFACTRGDGHACSILGEAYFNGPGGVSDPQRAAQLFARACAHADGPGCFNSGSDYEMGQGVAQSATRAISLYHRGCELDDLNSCAALGRMYEGGNGTPQDYARAVSLFARSCEAGNADGCEGLGRSYRDGHGVAIDLKMAARLFDKSRNLSVH